MLVEYGSFNLRLSWRPPDIHSWIWVDNVFPDCFANNAYHGSICCKLKLIHSYLRASVSLDKLCDLHLAYMSIERGETEIADFDGIIDELPSIQAQKALFL